MLAVTHAALGLLIGLLALPLSTTNTIIFLALVIFGSLLPDIDHEKSYINKKLKFTKVASIFKHRGIFHTIYPPALLYVLLYATPFSFIGLAVGIGYLAHLIGDSLTPAGINYLHPFASLHLRGPIRTGSLAEKVFLVLTLVVIVVVIV